MMPDTNSTSRHISAFEVYAYRGIIAGFAVIVVALVSVIWSLSVGNVSAIAKRQEDQGREIGQMRLERAEDKAHFTYIAKQVSEINETVVEIQKALRAGEGRRGGP